MNTARLDGLRPAPAHLEVAGAVFGDPLVAASLWPDKRGGPRSPEQSLAMVEADVAHWDLYGFGPWLYRLAADGRPAARGGLWRTVLDGRPATEVQYAVASTLWGQGLATEIARAAIDQAFSDLDLAELVSFTLPGNAASRRVMEKCGFAYERDITRSGLPHVLYRLSR